MAEEETFVEGFKSAEEFSQKTCKSMVSASRTFQNLPPAGSPAWDLRKTYPEFNRNLKDTRRRLISTMETLLLHVNIAPDDFRRRDVEEKFEFVVESNDELLERIATSLDKAEGLFKRAEIFAINPNVSVAEPSLPQDYLESSTSKSPAAETTVGRKIKKAFYRNKVKEKPQLKFSTPVDNSLSPFVPNLTYKPHAIKPLSILPEYNGKEEFYGHPYEFELAGWEPKPNMLKSVALILPTPIQETQLLYVETKDDLQKMLSDLENAPEVAVDVEHHSYRSFLGITCLIQISTRNHDYIVDTLALRDSMYMLNEIFTNPRILKVFHGANMDIPWLQKDFSVYVVGMFDTAIAAQTLKLPSTSLQYLLKELCQITTDKSYQLADWRIRPLSEDMIQYARADTHYLLYIYDLLKNQLLKEDNNEGSLLNIVYEQSRLRCLKRHEKPVNNPQVALRKVKRPLNNRQLHGFIELFKWRDAIAREKDESLGYVLPNHMLLTISETLPKEMTGILACCDPVPALLSQNLSTIHQIITEARDLPIHQDASMNTKSDKKGKHNHWMSMLDSIHEVSVKENETTNITSLKGSSNEWWNNIEHSDIKIKETPRVTFVPLKKRRKNVNSCSDNLSPFQRYKITTEILRNLKDPKKKEHLDMENPLIKSVAATLLTEASNIKEIPTQDLPKPTRKAAPLWQEFVPFNPMMDNSQKREKSSPRKDSKYGRESNRGKANQKESEDHSETVEHSNQKGKLKKQSFNFIKKLKIAGRKRKYELQSKEEDMEDGEIQQVNTTQTSTKSKEVLTSYISLDANRTRGESVHQQQRGSNSKLAGNKKKGFWSNSRGRGKGDGKSITFK